MADGSVRVLVCHSPAPREVREWALEVPAASTVSDVIAASPLPGEFPALDWRECTVGIWGRRCPQDQAVREGDRIEVYRPLLVDPKVARRERFRKQGARTAGLFARKSTP